MVVSASDRAIAMASRMQIRLQSLRWNGYKFHVVQVRLFGATTKTHQDSERVVGLTITDPLVLYHHHVDSGRIRPDEAQHRAAIEFQKLYYRVKDYMPSQDFMRQVEKLALLLEESEDQDNNPDNSNNPMPWFSPERHTLALIKTLSDEEDLFNLNTPQGLLVHGEVGSGKSMLMDLFAVSLPHASKRRWHYHNFMLSIYSRIHRQTIKNQELKNLPLTSLKRKVSLQNEYVLLKIAHELIEESAILLLDEFMLPDIAAAKIVKTLFTYYFKMGGVLVATSNRLPKELYSADFKRAQFTSFYDVLQARCVSYDMRSNNDWRELLSNQATENLDHSGHVFTIRRYWIQADHEEQDWQQAINQICGTSDFEKMGKPARLTVYGRPLHVPWQYNQIAKFHFDDICEMPLAGADYITLASTYHTLILDGVPALKLIKKNQARRLITLLDALYECRVRLVIRAETVIDDLFFADAKQENQHKNDNNATQIRQASNEDSLELEMYSEVDRDLSSPYRPNVSSYHDTETVSAYSTSAAATASQEQANSKNFTRASAFTGEDERFAYKRAISRVREMTGSDAWWSTQNWIPVDPDARPWETIDTSTTLSSSSSSSNNRGSVAHAANHDLSMQRLFKHGDGNHNAESSPFRKHPEPAPKFSAAHFWSMIKWGEAGRKTEDKITKRWLRGTDAFIKKKS
ncbi:AFG1-like ATPase-domain-containing protein, partial [Lipomyces japonicus]|uniref:AFG1-like ATPase-domain-containing protein n=1 Tax=Lipomyces japonicus TaxID=56871 RepID=UPI0034CEF4C8